MDGPPSPETLPEARLSELLRRVDWRFLLRQAEWPRILDLTGSRRFTEALQLIGEQAEGESEGADLVVLGFPTHRKLRRARAALRPGGEVACLWRLPRPAGARRARRHLLRAGFEDISVHWFGPSPRRRPEFWLPLEVPAARAWVLDRRPPRSPMEALQRRLWRPAEHAGLLVPLCAIGRAGEPPLGAGSPLDPRSALLLTEGTRASSKVVAIPFEGDRAAPAVVKAGRLQRSDRALGREAEALRGLERDQPGSRGVPRLRADWRVAGRRAISQTAIHGRALNTMLTPTTLPELAQRVTHRLAELVGDVSAPPAPEWRRRLVAEPLDLFEQRFGKLLNPGAIETARRALAELPDLPPTWEHRDCGVWNVIVSTDGEIAFLDWEFAVPGGLPGQDLAFFLATAAFATDGTLARGEPDSTPIEMSHRRTLDPNTASGQVAAACAAEYCARLGMNADAFPRLRLLSWIVQALTAYRGFELEAAGEQLSDSLRASTVVKFIGAEIRLLEGTSSAAGAGQPACGRGRRR